MKTKKQSVLFGLLLASSLCVTANAALVVKKSITEEKSLSTLLFQTSFTFEKEGKTPDEILKSLSASNKSLTEFLKKEDIRCTGGQTRMNPKYSFLPDNKKVFDGYTGIVSYTCTFDKLQSYNALLNASFDKSQKLSLSPIAWTIPEELRKEALKEVEKALVKNALNTVKEYESYTSKSCALTSLEVSSPNAFGNTPIVASLAAKHERTASFQDTFLPIPESVIVYLNGMIEIQCGNDLLPSKVEPIDYQLLKK